MNFEFFTTPMNFHLLPSIHVSFGVNERTGKVGAAMICIGFLCWTIFTAFPFDGDDSNVSR